MDNSQGPNKLSGTIAAGTMALKKCHECGKEISESAGKCPHCGAAHDYAGYAWLAVIVVIIVVIVKACTS